METANQDYVVLRYERAPRNKPGARRFGYSSDPEKRKVQNEERPVKGPLVGIGATKIYRPKKD